MNATGLSQTLIELLELEQQQPDVFCGRRTDEPWTRVYGGLVVAQALAAASRTVGTDRKAHSLHAYFLRPGDPAQPILYHVERDMDGRAFSSRRVVARQQGKVLLNASASFHVDEEGLAHSVPMPDVPGPEGLIPDRELRLANFDRIPPIMRDVVHRVRPVEFRPVEEQDPEWPGPGASRQHHWFRALEALPDDPAVHRAVLAYASDWVLVGTATKAHGKTLYDAYFQGASLSHVIWFHGDLRADEWLLYAEESPWTGAARGLIQGHVFTRDGQLVASVAQEALIRPYKQRR